VTTVEFHTPEATVEFRTPEALADAERWTAHNYHPLPVVVAEAEGAWVTDVDGRRYLDMLAGYSALNFGHRHPALIAAAHAQLDRLTLTSRAFVHDQFAVFCRGLAELCGKELVLPMNTGAEAVETAIKVARKWGYQVKGVPDGQAEIIVADGNFHGRTTTIVSFSTDPEARADFGPYTPGFVIVPYGDAEALAAAITPNTVAVLLIADEIQSGLGRTGKTFAIEHEAVVPDVYVLGKALGGGIVPVSAVAANRDVLGVLKPGEHGSTFGGNALACAVGSAVVALLATGEFQERSARLGARLQAGLESLIGKGLVAVRCRGLWAGVDIDPALMTGRQACERLAERGVLAKDTHGSTIRLAPPLVATEADLDHAVAQLAAVLTA
jgi:ornithine--oxo-acid transaminase